MPIPITCTTCGGKYNAPDDAVGRKVRCPKCRTILEVPALADAAEQKSPSPLSLTIAAWVAGAGLLLLSLSPLFTWINFGTGGVIGLSGDGKIVLGVTAVLTVAYGAAIISKRWLTPVVLGVQSWGTLAAFWMGALIWGVSTILNSPEVNGNPFAKLFATQVTPGTGLYLGLIGGLTVAGALGFLAVRRLGTLGKLKLYYMTQGLSCILGLLLALFVVSDRSSRAGGDPGISKATTDDDPLSWMRQSPSDAGAQTEWRRAHNVSDQRWDDLIANYKARKHPKSVGLTDWWKEAKDKTPAQLDQLYPPLQPHEWYRAEWPGRFTRSRELDSNFRGKPDSLKVMVAIETERGIPIKELHGHLAFVKDGKTIYETRLAEKPDVSFTDRHFVFLTVPYDDANADHRTLRFAKDDELRPVFTVSKVVLADGTVKSFEQTPPLPPKRADKKPEAPIPAKARTGGAAAYDDYPEPDRSKYVKDWEAERDALKRAIEDDKSRLSKATTAAEKKKYGDYVRTYTEKLATHEQNDPPFFLGPPPPKPVTVAPPPKPPAESPPVAKPMVEVVKVRLEAVRVVNSGANAVMVYVDWKNTGTRPVRSVRATIKAFDAKGKEVYSSEALVYEAPKDFPGVAPGATYTEPSGKGHLVPNEPGKTPVKATVEVTKVEEKGS